ncbi:hypothetical protein TNCV_477091 [Trichonephila clavipes]|nr:hypothetical protein TNCV_477091 [Trichonephila clavipes]
MILLGSTPISRENNPGEKPGAFHLSSPSTNLTRGLASSRLFRVPPPAMKVLFIYKHLCLLRDSNPVPTAPQSVPERGLLRCNNKYATRGLLTTDHVILNHGQVTWTTPELAPPSPNYHTTPTGGRFSSRQILRASLPYTAGL